MGVDEYGSLLLLELQHEVPHRFGRFGIQVGGRLIKKQQLGVMDQGSGNRQFLFGALGKGAHRVISSFPDAEHAQQAFDVRFASFG